jgi:translation initiation factor 4A
MTDVNTSELNDWDDCSILKTSVLRGIYAHGFDKPSPIQKKGIIPLITKVKISEENERRPDIIAQAQSGTGKTGCFSVGVLNIVEPDIKKTQAVILAPTHELASQICSVINSIGSFCKVKIQLLVGGTPVDKDKELLDNDTPHIVVGTPGRIHDMMRRKYLKTDDISIIVLDEADEMLSCGFKDQMYKIFQFMRNDLQIALFSATMPPELEDLTKAFMENPVKILVKAEMLTLQGIAQWYIKVENDEQKYLTLKDIYQGAAVSQTIIYCNSTRRVDDLHEAMSLDKFPVTKIHGKMEEFERRKNDSAFRNGDARVLITSDLYSRGMDVQQVSIVINFDLPKSKHTYLHRIGRSGRWGRKGFAINFITRHDSARKTEFEEYYHTHIIEMPADWDQKCSM